MRLALALPAVLAMAAPAAASAGLFCEGEGASLDLGLGRLQVLAVLDAAITVGDQRWVTAEHLGQGTPIAVGQAFSEGNLIAVDFTDDIVNEMVAHLRLVSGRSSDELVMGGVLDMPGIGSWVVSCVETG